MGGGSFQPDFKRFAALQSDAAKGSRDPDLEQVEAEIPSGEASEDKELTISMYQDPRDALDLERHQIGGIGKQVRE